MRLLMDQGDAMLCEEYTYPHIAESMVQPQGYAAIPLAMDAEGIIPGAFRTHLLGLRDAGQPLPKLLYTIPVGQNPTGEPLQGHGTGNIEHVSCTLIILEAAEQPSTHGAGAQLVLQQFHLLPTYHGDGSCASGPTPVHDALY